MNAPPFDWAAYRRGCRSAFCAGGAVLCGSYVGFGALVYASDLTIPQGVVITLTMWALPGQVTLVSLMDSDAGLLAIALAVTLTAVRLMPMVVAILPEMRVPGRPFWLHLAAGYFTAATVWLESRRVFPSMEPAERLPFMLGISLTFLPAMAVLTVVGYLIADMLPPLFSACLVFLTPAYFTTGLLASARDRIDGLSMVFGGLSFVAFHAVAPEFSMMLAGLVGGTVAYGISKWLGRRDANA